MNIFKLIINFFWQFIKMIFNFIKKITLYITHRNPILATGFIAFFFAFMLIAFNALFVQEIKADTINTRIVKIIDVQNNNEQATTNTIAVKPQVVNSTLSPKVKHKLNNYATKKAIRTVLKLSRRETKKVLRKINKRKKLH